MTITKNILLTTTIAVALLLLGVSTAFAATINVPGDEATVHDAVAAASGGDTITIDSGSYDLPSQLVIDKDLTVVGAGKDVTTLTTSFDTGAGGDSRGLILVEPGVVFHLSDLTIDGSGQLVYQGIRHRGSGTVDSVHFTEIKYNESGPHYSGVGMAAFGDGAVDVTNSMFDEMGRIGVLYFGSTVSGSVFADNTYVGKGVGDWLDYALDISAGIDMTVTGNTISGNRGVASSDGSTSAGLLVTTFFGAGTTALIEDNVLTDNTTGIAVGFDGSDTSSVEAHDNDITGNDEGVVSTAPEVDATCNWWGEADGPSGEGPGSGDSVSEDVLFTPWQTASDGPCDGVPDGDGDGVGDDVDMCEDTMADESPTKKLNPNRWTWDGSDWIQGTTKKGGANDKDFTIEETLGCSCDQILDNLEEATGMEFEGHRKFGCSQSILEDWIAGWYPLDSIMVSPHNDAEAFPDPVATNVELQAGENYQFVASGVWRRDIGDDGDGFNYFDAQYSSKNPDYIWGENGDADNGDLRINDVGNLWGALDDVDHTYEYDYSPGANEFTEFYIWMNDVTKYPDNLDEPLTVDVLLELY